MADREKTTQIAAITYTVREFMQTKEGVKQSLKKLSDIGLGLIQGGLPAGFEKEEFKDLLAENDLRLCCYGSSIDRMHTDLDGIVDEMKCFGVDTIMMGAIPAQYRDRESDYHAFAREFSLLGRRFDAAGIRLSYHNHAQEFRRFESGVRGIDILFEEFDPVYVDFTLDTHWVHSGGDDVIRWIKKCKGRMKLMHVKDYMIDPDPSITSLGQSPKLFAEIGEGNLEWPLIIETALGIGVHTFIIEQDFCRRDPFESVKISVDNLKKFGLK